MSSDKPSSSLVCSVVCLQPVDSESWDAGTKMAWRSQLRTFLAAALTGVRNDERTLVPLGEGVTIGFLRDPESALLTAFRLVDATKDPAFPALRAGVHLGSVVSVQDVHDMPSIFGDGINVAEQVMRNAIAGEVRVSAAFHSAVAYLSADHRASFAARDGFADPEGRPVDTYALQAAIPRLRDRLEAAHPPLQVAPVIQLAGISPPPAPLLTTQQQVLKTISTWVFPFNALVAFVGLSISGLERIAPGGSLTRAGFAISLTLAIALVALDVLRVLAWPRGLWSRPPPVLKALGSRAASVLGVVVTIMFGVGVLLLSPGPASPVATNIPVPKPAPALASPAASSSDSGGETQTKETANAAVSTAATAATASPSPTPATAIPATPARTEAASGDSTPVDAAPHRTVVSRTPPAPILSTPAPTRTPSHVLAQTNPNPRPAANERRSAAADNSVLQRSAAREEIPARSTRCTDIVMRASLGEPLSDADRETLKSKCR